MATFLNTFNQLTIMFLLAALGFFLLKKNLVSDTTVKQLSTVLVYIVIPFTIISSLQNVLGQYDWKYVLLSIGVNLVLVLLTLMVSRIFFKGKEDAVAAYAVLFSNGGFIGIPLVQSVIGASGMLNVSIVLLINNFFVFTYGIYLLSGSRDTLSRDRIIKNPGIILPLLGLVLYLFHVEFPFVIKEAFRHVANMNSPLAMIILGCYLAQSDWASTFRKLEFYKIATVRLIVAPLAGMVFLWLVPFIDFDMKMALLITAACPTAVHTFVISREFGNDYIKGARIVLITSLLSLFTIPVLTAIGSLIF